jgi:predicted MFS family arabinose efflux permease
VSAGAALSNTFGGYLIHLSGFRASFLGLGGVALAAFLMLFFSLPETGRKDVISLARVDAAL